MLDRKAVAEALRDISTLLPLSGKPGSAHRARAYETGARVVEALSGDLEQLVDAERLTDLPGIGPVLARTITELVRTGRSEQLERLRESLPAGVLELGQLPGMTLRRMALLQEELGITKLVQLEDACRNGRVRALKGFGAKLEAKLLSGIEGLATASTTLLLHEADAEGRDLLSFARSTPGVQRADLAGDLRRQTETVEELVVMLATAEPERVLAHMTDYPRALSTDESTPATCVLKLASGIRVRVLTAPPERHAEAWLAATGSAAHVRRLEELSRARLGNDLLEPAHGLAAATGTSEADLYARLGLPWIPPELREDAGEIEAALAGQLPDDLVREQDILGAVHCHTDYSDGKNTIEQMARAAQALGMRYLTITDHSPSAHYAGGVDEARLWRQWEEIEEVQQRVGLRLLRGTESDINADGSLDYPMRVLERMDVVIASIHNRHKMDAEEMTRRLVTALKNPVFKIWGHALGRYVGSRPPIACHMDEVLDAAAESRVAIEVNGDPHRLDLEPRWQREARRRGIPFVISTDAHSIRQLGNLRFGIAMARRGWLRRSEVLNTRDTAEFCAAVRPAG